MLSRRHLMLSATALSLAPLGRAFADTGTPTARLNALFDRFMDQQLDRSPESVTGLGLDTGARASAKFKLDDRSLAQRAKDKLTDADQLARLKAFDRASLSGMDAINYDTIAYVVAGGVEADRAFDYGDGAGAPYVISQLTGAYQQVPDFLDSQHTVETKADAEAYLARLEAFAVAMDQETEAARHDAGLGVIPPDFVIDKALTQMTAFRDTPAADAVLVQSVARRAKEKAVDGDWGAQAAAIYTGKVVPALDRQIALLKEWRAHAVHDAGVWRLPKGEAYYAMSLKQATTTEMTPAEVHKTGMDMVESLSAELDTLMKANGLTQGTVGDRLRGLYKDPKFRYPNTDEGKAKLIADLNLKVDAVQARLPQYFGVLPKAKVEIHRVPKYIEAGAPGGYYNGGSLDGKRPGAYYINLRDTAEVPSWTLPTLTYHESIPGHHLQITIQQEAPLPLIRKTSSFNAYQEGWAIYAEQLAGEMGMYDDDPFGRMGYLHDAIFRAVRLVVDTGMHQMRWSREQAVKYYVDHLGDQEASAITEVERYCVWPGQACSYMTGKLVFLKERAKAKAALGPKFDIRQFHDACLLPGAVPLEVLSSAIGNYVKARAAAA